MTGPRKCHVNGCSFHGANAIAALPTIWLCTAHLLDWMASAEFDENRKRFGDWLEATGADPPTPDAPVEPLVKSHPFLKDHP